jgi:hypothetical protein
MRLPQLNRLMILRSVRQPADSAAPKPYPAFESFTASNTFKATDLTRFSHSFGAAVDVPALAMTVLIHARSLGATCVYNWTKGVPRQFGRSQGERQKADTFGYVVVKIMRPVR